MPLFIPLLCFSDDDEKEVVDLTKDFSGFVDLTKDDFSAQVGRYLKVQSILLVGMF